MDSPIASRELSRRRLLQVASAAGMGLALGALGRGAEPAHAVPSPMTFGVGPFDRALDTLSDNGYRLRSAGLSVNGQDSILVDGTERTRQVLYRYADQVGPYVDSLGDLALNRATGGDLRYDRLLRAREEFYVYTAPVPIAQFYGVRRVFRVNERFGYGLLPIGHYEHGWGRPWPALGDFWGVIYAVDRHDTPIIWLIASTAEYRMISPHSARREVRTEVVAARSDGADWLGYQARDALLAVPLRRGAHEYFSYPNFG
jgi:hypothetical protein